MGQNEIELKPCPFCGGEAKYRNRVNRNWTPAKSVCCVYCTKCNASTDLYDDDLGDFSYMKKATEAWNRRAGK